MFLKRATTQIFSLTSNEQRDSLEEKELLTRIPRLIYALFVGEAVILIHFNFFNWICQEVTESMYRMHFFYGVAAAALPHTIGSFLGLWLAMKHDNVGSHTNLDYYLILLTVSSPVQALCIIFWYIPQDLMPVYVTYIFFLAMAVLNTVMSMTTPFRIALICHQLRLPYFAYFAKTYFLLFIVITNSLIGLHDFIFLGLTHDSGHRSSGRAAYQIFGSIVFYTYVASLWVIRNVFYEPYPSPGVITECWECIKIARKYCYSRDWLDLTWRNRECYGMTVEFTKQLLKFAWIFLTLLLYFWTECWMDLIWVQFFRSTIREGFFQYMSFNCLYLILNCIFVFVIIKLSEILDIGWSSLNMIGYGVFIQQFAVVLTATFFLITSGETTRPLVPYHAQARIFNLLDTTVEFTSPFGGGTHFIDAGQVLILHGPCRSNQTVSSNIKSLEYFINRTSNFTLHEKESAHYIINKGGFYLHRYETKLRESSEHPLNVTNPRLFVVCERKKNLTESEEYYDWCSFTATFSKYDDKYEVRSIDYLNGGFYDIPSNQYSLKVSFESPVLTMTDPWNGELQQGGVYALIVRSADSVLKVTYDIITIAAPFPLKATNGVYQVVLRALSSAFFYPGLMLLVACNSPVGLVTTVAGMAHVVQVIPFFGIQIILSPVFVQNYSVASVVRLIIVNLIFFGLYIISATAFRYREYGFFEVEFDDQNLGEDQSPSVSVGTSGTGSPDRK